MASSASTITNLIPTLYTALDVVSRELVGFIPAVTLDATTERAAKDQVVRSAVAPASEAGDIAPNVTPPDDGNQTIGNVSLTISKARRVPVRWQGEESRSLNAPGPGRSNIMQDQFAQAFRTLANEVEADLSALHVAASRAFGTAAATPFGTAGNYTDASNALKILLDNGSPNSDLHMVINTAAGANLRGLQGGKVNEAGSDSILRQGVLLDIHGMSIRESAQIKTPVAGTMSGGKVNNAGYAVGATAFGLQNATGTGVVAAGDVITISGDTNKYVVASATFAGANPATGDLVTIAAPGLRQAIPAANTAITVVAAAARNMAFRRSAIVLATRAPALPTEGDMADDRVTITDPRSGLSFEVSLYKQYRQVQYEIALAWGVKMVKPEHAAILLG